MSQGRVTNKSDNEELDEEDHGALVVVVLCFEGQVVSHTDLFDAGEIAH